MLADIQYRKVVEGTVEPVAYTVDSDSEALAGLEDHILIFRMNMREH